MGLLKQLKKMMMKQPPSPKEPVEIPEHNSKPVYPYIVDQFKECYDFIDRSFPHLEMHVLYLDFLAGADEAYREIIMPFSNVSIKEASSIFKRSQYIKVTDAKKCVDGILNGQAAIFFQNNTYLVDISRPIGRQIEASETETVIVGPHDGFVENSDQNVTLIRKRIKSNHLKTVRLTVGEITKTEVILLYLDDIANNDLVETLKKRIQTIEIDGVIDANMLVQYIDENPNSVFPQYLTTERPDAIISKIIEGRIAGIVGGSPTVFCCPTSFFDFSSSPDDYYQRWQLGTAQRLLRYIGLIITLSFTALYVAVTTFHYEMIPHTMLLQLTESRSKVPFPPLIEALIMETTIELLREAGARLPSKIGQTIGIVGGIVIGQAAVQAGFTSNILIIAVAISAISSFVIPSYLMSASIRVIRFGIIILAGVMGNLGIMVGITIIVIHLSGITNLGTSYLMPVAPLSFFDWLDAFIRGPFYMLKTRPAQTKAQNQSRNKMRR